MYAMTIFLKRDLMRVPVFLNTAELFMKLVVPIAFVFLSVGLGLKLVEWE